MKDIIGYEGLYAIEEDGRVFGIKRNQYLTPVIREGYYQVGLCKNGNRTHKNIHRLLALTFIPNPDNKSCVDHINRNTKDNRLENLRWATRTENARNCSLQKNNKLQEQYIHFYHKKNKEYGYYVVQLIIDNKRTSKSFKTLEEAKAYRDNLLT